MSRRKFAALFTVVGLITVLTMFVSILGNIYSQSKITNTDIQVISAFEG